MKTPFFITGHLFLFALVSATTFKTRCDKAVTSSLNIADIDVHYYRGSCFVMDNRKKKFDETVCKHFLVKGYMALLPGTILVNKIYELFRPFMSSTGNKWTWMGFKRNDSTSAGNSRDVWYWYISDEERWHGPEHFVKWKSSEPNEGGMTCGHLWNFGSDDAVWNVQCTYEEPYLCEYRDKQGLRFKGKLQGVRGSANVTVSEHTAAYAEECGLLCTKLPICQSYTHSKQQQLCALHFLPVEELITEPLSDGKVFDIIE